MTNIVVCGVLCNNDIALAELLSRYGFSVKVLRQLAQKAISEDHLPGKLKYFSFKNIKYIDGSLRFFYECSKANLVVSINGYYPAMMGFKAKLLSFFCFKKVNVINLTCGSDITEFVVSNTVAGRNYRNHLIKSFFNYISPYPNAIKNLFVLGLSNFAFYRFNYYLLGEFFINDKREEKEYFTFFHPSNLDWGCRDSKLGRNSTKGNDRFIRAFIRALDAGINAKCILLDRGPDKEEAKNLIKKSVYSKFFEFKDQMTPAELRENILDADIIVDQFDVGGFGGIAFETMAQAKPLMIYVDKDCWPLVYDEEPPIINCHTEDEIYNAIVEWTDRSKLKKLGEKAEKWVRIYHDVQTADFSEFILRICLGAGLKWPRKDLAKAEAALK
jgi:glycosyltransferase involved in cell wall biosynthesis